MRSSAWRNLSLILGTACLVLTWRTCQLRRETSVAIARCADTDAVTGSGANVRSPDSAGRDGGRRAGDGPVERDDEPAADITAWGFRIPGWVRGLAPQPGEALLDYRDRMVPLAQAVVAPHRARVARGRDAFAAAAQLDGRQRAELDAAVDEASAAIQDRAMQGLLSGELLPGQLKPSTGVAFARDVLDSVDRASQRFSASLREPQRAALADSSFDVAEYLLFSTRWEDMLGVTE